MRRERDEKERLSKSARKRILDDEDAAEWRRQIVSDSQRLRLSIGLFEPISGPLWAFILFISSSISKAILDRFWAVDSVDSVRFYKHFKRFLAICLTDGKCAKSSEILAKLCPDSVRAEAEAALKASLALESYLSLAPEQPLNIVLAPCFGGNLFDVVFAMKELKTAPISTETCIISKAAPC